METLIAACGLLCSKCDAYIATRNYDYALIQKTAEAWQKTHGGEIPPETVWCTGCMTEGGPKCVHCSQGCEVRRCVLDKKYDSCADCAEYPCSRTEFIVAAVPATKTLLEALKTC